MVKTCPGDISGNVKGVNDFHGSGTSSGGTGTTEYYTFTKKLSNGKYFVTLTYSQNGPYWEADAAIHEKAEFTIAL
ncbi:hypothetical protein V492_06522 [Pseudogymnoascus sp. VKM F-4246]|nr:hypothetical protein V492_06522 [Pseudogymnoascus sp. VKM F-4246]